MNILNSCNAKYLNCSLHVIKRLYGSIVNETIMTRVLNVAEKNDAAKHIAAIMSRGSQRMREGLAKYNKIYEFNTTTPSFGQCVMTFTSVSGHLLNYDFAATHRLWHSCDPKDLFQAPLQHTCIDENANKIKNTLEREANRCQVLIIWTDCDREGENIGFQVINVCKNVNQRLRVFRAKFSEITPQAINRAMNNLSQPDIKISNAVDVRQQLDLRIGSAFTRFLTMGLQSIHGNNANNRNNNNNNNSNNNRNKDKSKDGIISYGSCQFPTLGFVVDRFKQRENFVPQKFWSLEVTHTRDNIKATFNWSRVRLFDEKACLAIFCKISDKPLAEVVNVSAKRKTKWRPLPMDTVTFERSASSKLKINAKKAMEIAEKLYTRGFISYPRTETNQFPPDINLRNYVEMQTNSGAWGEFANRVLQHGPNPRQGNKTDKAHPPIYPTKFLDTFSSNEEKRIYELIVRHFLACLDYDAVGNETNIHLDISEEIFNLNGLRIQEKNYLEVYIYDKWSDKNIPQYNLKEKFTPDSIMMNDGQTTAPELLTEAQLIALMEKYGIGTDATHADHIEKIKTRKYIVETADRKLKPEGLGIGLVDGYDQIGYEMSKPHLRAALELDLRAICDGIKFPNNVLSDQIKQYERVFIESERNKAKLFEIIKTCFQRRL